MSKVHNVVFTQKWDIYNPGDRAGFTKDLAKSLIDRRVAQKFEGLPVAERGEDIPEAAMSEPELKHVRESKKVLKKQEEAEEKEAEKAAKRQARFQSVKNMFPGKGK